LGTIVVGETITFGLGRLREKQVVSEAKRGLHFLMSTRFEDLPVSVVDESKRLFLDSIGVAIVGLKLEKGRIAMELTKQIGGPC